MNATTDSLAVVKARLPYTDRGSFSQAWFSALHLATDPAGSAPVLRAHRPLDERARVASDAPARGAGSRDAQRSSPNATARPLAARDGASQPSAARLSRTPTAARASTGSHAREGVSVPFAATLSIGEANGRIRVLVRRDGDVMHVVALCSERNAEVVRRALATTERALRARGARIATSVRTYESEAGS